MSKKTKKLEPKKETVEPLKEEKSVAEEKVIAEEPTTKVKTAETEKIEEPATIKPKEAEISTPFEAPKPKTLDERLLEIYIAAPPGNISIAEVMIELGVENPILIMQAWDRLYDLHKVPFSKLFKPPMGYVGIE